MRSDPVQVWSSAWRSVQKTTDFNSRTGRYSYSFSQHAKGQRVGRDSGLGGCSYCMVIWDSTASDLCLV
jgi:hypothetical protein